MIYIFWYFDLYFEIESEVNYRYSFFTIVHTQRFQLKFFLERSSRTNKAYFFSETQQEIVYGKARKEKGGCVKQCQLKIIENNLANVLRIQWLFIIVFLPQIQVWGQVCKRGKALRWRLHVDWEKYCTVQVQKNKICELFNCKVVGMATAGIRNKMLANQQRRGVR